MRLPASTQAVPDTCGAAGAISSPAEPLCTQKSPGKTSVTTPGSEHALCLHFCLTPGIRLGALTSRVPGRDAKVPSPPARPAAIARKQVITRPSPHRPATGSWLFPGRRPHSPLELEARRAQSQLSAHPPSVAKNPVPSSGGIRGLVFMGVRVASSPHFCASFGGQDNLKSHTDDRTNPGPRTAVCCRAPRINQHLKTTNHAGPSGQWANLGYPS